MKFSKILHKILHKPPLCAAVLNEVELCHMLTLAGVPFQKGQWEACVRAARAAYHCGDIVLTLGDEGFCALEGDAVIRERGVSVPATDTTGAGDGFLGAMVARLTLGESLGDACRWANRYSSITVQRSGTISSYPTLEEAEQIFRTLPPLR